MKTLNSIIEEKVKEIKSRLHGWENLYDNDAEFNADDLIRQSLTSIAKEALEAVRLEYEEIPVNYCDGKIPTSREILEEGIKMGEINGHRKAVSEQNNKINKFIIEEKNYCVQCGREVEKNTPLCSDCRLEI